MKGSQFLRVVKCRGIHPPSLYLGIMKKPLNVGCETAFPFFVILLFSKLKLNFLCST